MAIKLRPLKTTKKNISLVLNTLSQFLISILYGVIYFMSGKFNKKMISLIVGVPLLSILMAILVLNNLIELIFSFILIFSKIKKYFSNKKKGRKMTEKKKDDNNESKVNESHLDLNIDDLNSIENEKI